MFICSETYLESCGFDSSDKAVKMAKYLMTKFCRALLYLNKSSLLCAKAWGAVPMQSYEEDFWDGGIDEIDNALMNKYNVPEHIRQYVFENIQPRTMDNIKIMF